MFLKLCILVCCYFSTLQLDQVEWFWPDIKLKSKFWFYQTKLQISKQKFRRYLIKYSSAQIISYQENLKMFNENFDQIVVKREEFQRKSVPNPYK